MSGFLIAILAFAPWHQGVRYEIDARLDDSTHRLFGHEIVVYVNHSPETLREIWFHLYANAFKKGSVYFKEIEQKFGIYSHRYADEDDYGWIDVSNVNVDGSDVQPTIDDTRMKLPLSQPLAPNDTARIELDFVLKIPKNWSRLGHRGHHYDLTQWYPRIVVFDEFGWHPDGYHIIGEFYGEFAHYDVKLTIPKRYVLGSTGEIVAPKDYIARLDSIANGLEVDTTVDELVTVKMVADSVHDFAIVADPSFKIIKRQCGRTTVYIMFPPKYEKTFAKADSFVCRVLDDYERWYGQYPYEKLTVTWGTHRVGGMEYPNLVIVRANVAGIPGFEQMDLMFESVVAHEIAHQWFYGIIANNEMDEAWLDESFATFTEQRYMETHYPPDSLRNRMGFLKFLMPKNITYRKFGNPILYSAIGSPMEDPIVGKKAYESRTYTVSVYQKGAAMLHLLRAYLGEAVFDSVMHEYYRRCRFKHVRTQDFIDVVEDVVGEDMDWFFDPWLYSTDYPDFKLKSVKRVADTTIVEVENSGDVDMVVDVVLGDDTVWLRPSERVAKFVGQVNGRPILDPDDLVLEKNKCNNRRRIKFSLLSPDFTDPGAFSIGLIPLLGIDAFGLAAFGMCEFRHLVQGFALYDRKQDALLWSGRYTFQVSKLVSMLEFGMRGYGSTTVEGGISYSKTKRKMMASPLEWTWDFELNFGRCTDTVGVSPYWEVGRFVGAQAGFYRWFRSPLFTNMFGLDVGGFYAQDWGASARIQGKAEIGLRHPFRLTLRTKLAYLKGDAPAQLMPFLEGRPFVGFDQFYTYGGLVGYAGRGLKGRIFAMAELDKPIFTFVNLYGAVGWIDSKLEIDSRAYWEAGIKVIPKIEVSGAVAAEIPIEVVFPIWISRPAEGEKSFGLRFITVIE